MDFALSGESQYIDHTDFVVQQIENLFDAVPGDLLGDIEYGTDYEYLLHDLRLNGDNLANIVHEDILSCDLQGHEVEVEGMLLEGTEREIALVDIQLKSHIGSFNKTYSIK